MKKPLNIECPHCHKSFNLSDITPKELREQLKSELFLEAQREFGKELPRQVFDESAEHQRLKDLEKDKLIADLRADIDLLQRKATQGSQQIQGEILEKDLAEKLHQAFPADEINRVAKGKNGADVIQVVRNSQNQECGSILWEAKNTHTWNDKWLAKVQDDSTRCKAHLAVILTRTLPKDIKNFGRIGTVWVTNNSCFLGLALALRSQLIQFEAVRPSYSEESTMGLFNYLKGPEFSRRVETIAGAIGLLKIQLDREKQSFSKAWTQREKLIENIAYNVSSICGELQGFATKKLPDVTAFSQLPLSCNEIEGASGSQDIVSENTQSALPATS